jgi:hypothetical protein
VIATIPFSALRRAAAGLLFCLATAAAPASALAQSEWDGVARIAVIGDLHGDYEKFVAMAEAAGVIDANGDWDGGSTHLVQMGDVPDRGPDTRKILDHLMRLEPQALAAGGRVHALIGNHEAMNITGDLRYVDLGEYAAFITPDSARVRAEYFRKMAPRVRPPRGVRASTVNDAYREQWDKEHPLGWVEHRAAWSPEGAYGRWIAANNAVIRINDMLFLHAGIGPEFAPILAEETNGHVRAALLGAPDDPAFADILEDQEGPLWYRGLALNAEDAEAEHLATLLARFNVKRVVVGHTKRAAMVLPRFGGRVILTDVALPTGAVDPYAVLIAENGALSVVHRGQRVPMGSDLCAYISAVAALDPPTSPTQRLVPTCGAPGRAIAVSRTNDSGK